MKASLSIFASIFVLAGLISCEKNTAVKPVDFPPDLSGVYIGQAKILVEETQYWLNDSTKLLTLRDELVDETITVTAIDVATFQYKVEKTSSFNSFYDIADEQQLDSTYRWTSSYEYDKEWVSILQLQPETNTLEASMLVQDIFVDVAYDSLGNELYHFRQRKEYSITAVR